MPARKPLALNRRKDSKADRAARSSSESMITPTTKLVLSPPKELKGLKIASETWKKVIKLQEQTQAAKDGNPLITSFDERTLVTYCKMIEEEAVLETKLSKLDKAQEDFYKKASKFKPTKDNYKDWVSMWSQFNGLTANFKGMSARLDAHRSSLHELSKSMYLTPASRAGMTPPMKEPEAPKSDMEKILHD